MYAKRIRPNRPISQSSPFLEPVRFQKLTVLTVPLYLECGSVSIFHPQLCIDAKTRKECDGKASKQPQSRLHDCVYSPLKVNAAPTLPRFFFTPNFSRKNGKHYTLRYVCGLNYFAHFDSSTTQNHIVDFVNHFGVVTSTRRPERCSSFVDVRPRLNSFTQL